jgi:hypothetical protein
VTPDSSAAVAASPAQLCASGGGASNSKVTARHEELILGLRRERKRGPLRIQAKLLRLHNLRFSTATIWKVLDRHQAKPLLRHRPSPP